MLIIKEIIPTLEKYLVFDFFNEYSRFIEDETKIQKIESFKQDTIKTNCDWFVGYEYFIVDDDGERIVFRKCYMDIPKRAYKISKTGAFTILSDAQLGVFETCIEESNEDELVVYYI